MLTTSHGSLCAPCVECCGRRQVNKPFHLSSCTGQAQYISPTRSIPDPPALGARFCRDEIKKADSSLPLSGPGTGLDLTLPSPSVPRV